MFIVLLRTIFIRSTPYFSTYIPLSFSLHQNSTEHFSKLFDYQRLTTHNPSKEGQFSGENIKIYVVSLIKESVHMPIQWWMTREPYSSSVG